MILKVKFGGSVEKNFERIKNVLIEAGCYEFEILKE